MLRTPALTSLLLAACGGGDDGSGPDAGDAPDLVAVPTGCVPGRTTADRADDQHRDQLRVLYVIPSDGADAQRDTSGQICNSVRAFATWFHGASGQYLRFDTADGLVDIGFVQLGKTDALMRGDDPNNASIDTGTAFVRERIERELGAAGLVANNKLYAVYYEGSSIWACGAGAYPPQIIGRVGAMYLRALPPGETVPCGDSRPWGQASLAPNYVDDGMLHELVHSLGFVPATSPNQHSFGHVYDQSAPDPALDLMYSPRAGQPDAPWDIDAPGGLVLDLGHDDYFGVATGLDLANSSLLAPLPANPVRPIGW